MAGDEREGRAGECPAAGTSAGNSNVNCSIFNEQPVYIPVAEQTNRRVEQHFGAPSYNKLFAELPRVIRERYVTQYAENVPSNAADHPRSSSAADNDVYMAERRRRLIGIADLIAEDARARIVAALAGAPNPERITDPVKQAIYAAARADLHDAEKTLELAGVSDEPEPEKWKVYTMKDAFVERPPVDWIARPYIEKPGLCIVYGQPGGHKTNVVLDLMVHVAAGLPWLSGAPEGSGLPVANVSPVEVPRTRRILLVDQDNGPRRTLDRLAMFARGIDEDEDLPISAVSMPLPPLSMMDAEAITRLIGVIRETRAEVVVLDNLATISGDAVENSNEMSPIMIRLRQIAEKLNVALILVHHERKHQKDEGRAGERLRGHSSIEAAVDSAFHVKRDRGEKVDLVTMTATKARGDWPPPLSMAFWYERDVREETTTRAGFYMVDAPADLTYNSQCYIVYEAIRRLGDRANQSRIVEHTKDALGMGKEKIKTLLVRMERENLIKTKPGQKNEIIFYIE